MGVRTRRAVTAGLAGSLAVSLLLVAPTAASGHAGRAGGKATATADATLIDQDGVVRGDLVLVDDGTTTLVQLSADHLPKGLHGLQIHPTRSCQVPFGSKASPVTTVALPGLTPGTDGSAELTTSVPSFGLAKLLQTSGASVIIHALPDNAANVPSRYQSDTGPGPDATTQATGDAGLGLQCGVLQAEADSNGSTPATTVPPGPTGGGESAAQAAHSVGRASRRALMRTRRAAVALLARSGGNDLARADLVDTAGRPVGRVTILPDDTGALVTVDTHGLAPGVHGLQIHGSGTCTTPSFASAGPKIGANALPNIVVRKDGKAVSIATAVTPSLAALLRGDGSSIVVTSAPDNGANIPARYTATGAPAAGPDATTRATGDAGAAQACGVLRQVPVTVRYVEDLYITVDHREPTAAESSRWVGFLNGGGNRVVLTHALISSAEGLGGLVDNLYGFVLQAAPSAAARAAYVRYLQQPGSTVEAVDAALAGSDAFYTAAGGDPGSFVAAIYNTFLGRDPSSVERKATQDQLGSGVPRAAIVGALLSTDEYRVGAIQGEYSSLSDADPTLVQYATWLTHLRHGGDLRPLDELLLAAHAFYVGSIDPFNAATPAGDIFA